MKITFTTLVLVSIFSFQNVFSQGNLGRIIDGPGGSNNPLNPFGGTTVGLNGTAWVTRVTTIEGPFSGVLTQVNCTTTTDDYSNQFERKMFGLPSPGGEQDGDNTQGPNCGQSDLISTVCNDYFGYVAFDDLGSSPGNNNLIFRLRVGDRATAVQSWHILADIDGKFGPVAEGNGYSSANPGFELDFILINKQNPGVAVYWIDNRTSCSQAIFLKDYPLATHYQVAIADLSTCGDADYFYDFYYNWNDLKAAITPFLPQGQTLDTKGFRFVASTSQSPSCFFGGTVAEVGGVDNQDPNYTLASALESVALYQCPTPINDLGPSGTGFGGKPNTPVITSAIAGNNIVSGTIDEDLDVNLILVVYPLMKDSLVFRSPFINPGPPKAWTFDLKDYLLKGGDKIVVTASYSFVSEDGCTGSGTAISQGEVIVRNILLSSSVVPENVQQPYIVGNLSLDDNTVNPQFSIVGISGQIFDNSSFTINTNKQLVINASPPPDFESTKKEYKVGIKASVSGTADIFAIFTILVTDVNEAPTDISLTATSIDENASPNSTVGFLSTTDPDLGNTFTYTLVAGTDDTDNPAFTITGNKVEIKNSPDYELKSSYSIRVQSTDNGVNGGALSFAKSFTIRINNINEAPTDITLSGNTIPENAGQNKEVGTLTTTDPDNSSSFTYTLVPGIGDNGLFNISGSSLRAANSLDFESKEIYSIRIKTTDDGANGTPLSLEKDFYIRLTDVNEAPTDISLSALTIAENSPIGTVVGEFSTIDPDLGNTFTYALIAWTVDTDNSAFTVTGNQLKINNSPDFEVKSSYTIRVQSTDNGVNGGALSFANSFTITINNINEAPTDIALSATSIPENSGDNAIVGTLSTTDPDNGNLFTYTLVPGFGDNSLFNIDGSSLRATSSFDFESRFSYSIKVKSTDNGVGGNALNFEKEFTITVTPVNEAPSDIDLSNNLLTENSGVNATVGTFSTVDPDSRNTFTYALVSGADDTNNGLFKISGTALIANSDFDFESKSSYSIRVRSTDQGSLAIEKVFTISITDVNDAPTDITLSKNSIDENAGNNEIVGAFSTKDEDAGNTFNYSLVTGTGDADNDDFTITNDQLIIKSSPNYESKLSYSIRVRTTDNGGLSFDESFIITVNNLNEAPVFIPPFEVDFPENGSGVAYASIVTDEDTGATLTFTYIGDDVSEFDISPDGKLTFKPNLRPDFENPGDSNGDGIYELNIVVTDGTNTVSQGIKIRITNVNEPPTASNQTVSYNVNLANSFIFRSTDDDTPTLTYFYTISDAAAGSISLASGLPVNFDNTTSEYSFSGGLNASAIYNPSTNFDKDFFVTYRVSDGSFTSQPVTITFKANNLINDPPIINTIVDNTSNPDPVILNEDESVTIKLESNDIDIDDRQSLIIFSLPKNGRLTCSGCPAILPVGQQLAGGGTFISSEIIYVPNPNFSGTDDFRIQSSDLSAATTTLQINVRVEEVNDAPTITSLSEIIVPENSTGTVYTATATDIELGSTLTYAISGTDAAKFTINPSTGEIAFINSPDFESPVAASLVNIYLIQVIVYDGPVNGSNTLSNTKAITINVGDVNEAPTDIALSAASIAENAGIDVIVGTLSSTDPDSDNKFSYTLVAGFGDNSLFNINGSSLRAASSFDFETKSSLSIRIRTTDDGVNGTPLSFEKNFTIAVTNVNETPAITSGSSATTAENSTGTVYTITAADPDAGTTLTYSLSGTDASVFSVNPSTGLISFLNSPDFELPADAGGNNEYNLTVNASDGSLTGSLAITIKVTNVNETPVITSSATATFSENNLTIPYEIKGIDPDAGTSIIYSISGPDAALFNVDPSTGEVTFKTTPNFEQPADVGADNVYNITVSASDGIITVRLDIVIIVTDRNENPTDVALNPSSISENNSPGATIGSLSTTDPDSGDSFSYALVSGTGADDNANFTISGGAVLVIGTLDFEIKNSFNIRVKSTDQNGLSVEKPLVITVINLNETPSNILLSSSTIPENNSVGAQIGNLSTEDSDIGDTFIYTFVSGAGSNDNAKFTIDGSSLKAAESFNFEVKASYTIRIRSTDQTSLFTEKVFNISITNANDPPIANSQSVFTIEDSITPIILTAIDLEGDPLTYSVLSTPANGTLSCLNCANPTYQPNTNFFGTDSFTFSVNDGLLNSNIGVITINVGPINDVPVANNQSVVLIEDEPKTFSIPYTDPDNTLATLTFAIVNQPTKGTVTISNGSFTYTPNSNFNGNDSFTYSVNDGLGSGTGIISLTVTPVNDAPVANGLSVTTSEDVAASFNVTYSDVDNTLASLVLTVTIPPANGTVTNSGGAFVYSPNNNFNGSDSFTYSVSDGSLSATALVNITVTSVNDVPTSENLTVSTDEDIPVDISLKGTDVDKDPLTFRVVTNPTKGSVTISGSVARYTPNLNYNGQDSFTYVSSDGVADSSPATVSITVKPVNDAPFISQIPITFVEEDQKVTVCTTVGDVDGDEVTLKSPEAVSGGGVITLSATNKLCFDYQPADSFSGNAFWRIQACDSNGACTVLNFQFIITPVNDVPIAENDEITVRSFEQSEIINLLQNDSDSEGDQLKVTTTLITAPSHGIYSLSSGGAFQYQSELGYIGDDQVVYEVCDTGSPTACSTATVTIKVLPPKFRVYEGLSPNGDGINDYWRLDGMEEYPQNRVQIFDRYNNLVFEIRGYDNSSNAWRGQGNSGLTNGNLPDGTYFYVINLNDGKGPYSGFVVLKRN